MFKKGLSDIDIIFATSGYNSGSLAVTNTDRSSKAIQVYDKNGPVTKSEVFSLEEIEIQWICMASKGRRGRPGHPSYDPNPEWSECNTATINHVTSVALVLLA